MNSILLNGSSQIYVGDVLLTLDGEILGKSKTAPYYPHQGVFCSRELLSQYQFDSSFRIFGDLDLWKRLQADNLLSCKQLGISVALMERDGVGSHPSYVFKRIADKYKIVLKHGGWMHFIFSTILNLSGFLFYKIFGLILYYKVFDKFVQKVRSLV